MTDYIVLVLVTILYSGLLVATGWLLKTNPELLAGYNRLTEEQRRPERFNSYIDYLVKSFNRLAVVSAVVGIMLPLIATPAVLVCMQVALGIAAIVFISLRKP